MKKILQPEDIMPFGKNKGLQLSMIYHYQPNYIEWLIFNTDHMAFDLEAFEKLSNPKPFAVGAVSGSQERKRILNSNKSLLDKYILTDNVNMLIDVRQIMRMDQENPAELEEIDFKFSDEAKKVNHSKINQ
jgi:hypothetical protein